MPQRLPRILVIGLAVTTALSFCLSMYLESFQLEFLQKHPISVNLVSGLVGFTFGALVVAVGFNRLRQHATFRTNRIRLLLALLDFRDSSLRFVRKIPERYQVSTDFDDGSVMADPWSWAADSPGQMADWIDTDDARQERVNAYRGEHDKEDGELRDRILELVSEKLLHLMNAFEIQDDKITDAGWNCVMAFRDGSWRASADNARALKSALLYMQEMLDRIETCSEVTRFQGTLPKEWRRSVLGL